VLIKLCLVKLFINFEEMDEKKTSLRLLCEMVTCHVFVRMHVFVSCSVTEIHLSDEIVAA